MNLSPHFTLTEFTRSDVARRLGIDNSAPLDCIERMKALCGAILEPAWHQFGVIRINSGYRCLALNQAIRGSKTSQHMRGEAADIEAVDTAISNYDLAKWIADNCRYDQIILECYTSGNPHSGWVHVSYTDGTCRRDLLTYDGKHYSKGLTP